MELSARDIVTEPSSSGCLNTSRTFLLNSGNSSRKSTPLCARLTSPGFGICPPPTIATSDKVWCGERKDRVAISDWPWMRRPTALWILVVCSASSKVISGSIVGILLASIVFPDPGGPIISMLCPPVADTSIALLTCSCPFTSAKSSW